MRPRIDVAALKETARNRWVGIFQSLGIQVPLPPGNHGVCPVCPDGGTDRFRLDKDPEHGTWFCGQCSPKAGDGISLVQRSLGLSFVETLERISEVVGISPEVNYEGGPKKDPREGMADLWKSSTPVDGATLTAKYLAARGLVMLPVDLRDCPECYNAETKTKMPAMLSVMRDPKGGVIGIHRTYLDGPKKADVPKPKKMMPPLRPLAGSAVRLYPPQDDWLGIAEGVETAIACRQLFDAPTWATTGTSLLESWIPPEGIRRVTIFGDCDPNFVGHRAAYRLANKLYSKPFELIVEVQIPSTGDWADAVARK